MVIITISLTVLYILPFVAATTDMLMGMKHPKLQCVSCIVPQVLYNLGVIIFCYDRNNHG